MISICWFLLRPWLSGGDWSIDMAEDFLVVGCSGTDLLNFMCCHTEIKIADQTFYLTRPTSPCADPLTPGAWQGSHWSTNIYVAGLTWPGKRSTAKAGTKPRSVALKADALLLGQPSSQQRRLLPQRSTPSQRILLRTRLYPSKHSTNWHCHIA